MNLTSVSRFKDILEYSDYTPFVSFGKNLVDIFAKFVWKPEPGSLSSYAKIYDEHITRKTYLHC